MDWDEEAALIKGVLESLRGLSGQKFRSWLSPIRSESMNTPDLVAAQGIGYPCDWANDDMPYAFETQSGTIHNMPHTMELYDQQILISLRHTEQEYVDQLKDQFDCLYAEVVSRGGRVMAINLNPWVTAKLTASRRWRKPWPTSPPTTASGPPRVARFWMPLRRSHRAAVASDVRPAKADF